MSKNISVKINNGNKTLESVKLNSANQKVIIKAQPHVNYELVDEATQYAPEMIDTKRVGNDLYIAFEGTDINKESDLVLEGYYEHDNTELVLGMAEDGQYYAYVPQSGVESDAVTLLADQVFAPQALGGNSVTAPFWAFNPSWLWVAAGVAAVGGIIAAASGSHGGGSSNNANNNSNTAKDTTAPAKPTVEAKDNGSVEVTPPADADTKSVEVNYTDEAGTPKTATLTKGTDGTWTSDNPDVALDPATGKATIPADKVKDGSPVTAKATDTSGNTGEEGTANAGNNVDHTVPNAPEVTSSTTDGSVTVQVPSNAKTGDMVEVTITPDTVSGNATPITVTLTKQADGSWTSDNESAIPNVKAGENSSIIPEDKVEDLSKVTVVTKDAMGNVSNKVETIAPLDPAKLSVNEEGKVVLTLPKQVNEGDLIFLTTISGSRHDYSYNGTNLLEFYKTATGWDIDAESREAKEDITKVDEYTYILNNLKPTSRVMAQHIEKDAVENFPNNADESSLDNETTGYYHTISDRTKGSVASYVIVPADNVPPGKPTVSSNADGSVNITPPTDLDVKTIEVNYIDENGNPQNAVLTSVVRHGDYHYGGWTSNNPDVKVGKYGEATISADKVKDGSLVTAKATDESGNTGEEGSANAGNNLDTTAPAQPTVEAKMNGFVYITPPADEDTKSVEVRYIDEKGNPQTVTITKDADKGWVSSNPENIWLNSETGKITLLAHKVKGGSLVKASATDNQGNTGEEATANAVNITDTYGPNPPEVWDSYDSVKITLPKDADIGDSVVIEGYNYNYDKPSVLAKNNIEVTKTLATLTKQQDGSWISDKPENVPNVDAGNDTAIVPNDALKGIEAVSAYATDPVGNKTFSVLADHYNMSSALLKITEKDGFMEITHSLVEDHNSIDIRYTDKAGKVKITTLTKGEDGNWTSDNQDVTVNPATGEATISVDKIQDTSKVYARVAANSDMKSNWVAMLVDKNPDTIPSAPEVIPSTTDGSVTVKVPDDAKVGDTVEVNIIPETSDVFLDASRITNRKEPIRMLLTKNQDGSWTSVDLISPGAGDSIDPNELNYAILPHIAAGQNSTTIPQDQVKDGSNVVVRTIDIANHKSAEVTAQAGEDTGEAGVSSNTIGSNGMGSSGDDFASFKQIGGTINMGAGNDILEARDTNMPFFFYNADAHIYMESGDDIVRTSGTIEYDIRHKDMTIDGGDDFDKLEFVNRDGKAIITKISVISNFEKIDIKGTLNNTVNIHKDDVERNHSAKATVDDSGKSHNNVLIVDGDEGDKVNLSEISKVASSQVNYEGNTYHVYHTGSNELWIDSDIAVA